MAKDRLVLIDGTAMVFRAFFAIPSDLVNKQGLHTNAIFGFARTLKKLLSGRAPSHACVVFDAPGQTFREQKFPAYKAQRPMMPAELAEQIAWIDRVVDVHRFKRIRVEGYEADDVIGTLTKQGRDKGMEVLIVSGDKDFCQLIDEDVRMLDPIRDVTYDPELVRKKWGVLPSQFVDLLALMGDDVDNVPGVPGIGQKGAAQLLATHGSLARMIENIEALDGRKKKALTEHRELALLSQSLATIDVAVPLPFGIDDLRFEPPDLESQNALYRELEFYSLLSQEARAAEDQIEVTGEVLETLESLATFLVGAKDQSLVLEALFDKPSVHTGAWVGLAMSVGGRHAYVPTFDRPSLLAALKPILEDSLISKVAHDAKALWVLLQRHGIRLEGVVFDTMLASFLIDPTGLIPHRLDQLAKAFAHRTISAEKSVTGSGQSEVPMHQVPIAQQAKYAMHRVELIAAIHPVIRERLERDEQTRILETLDLPLSWVLGRMELRGIKVDIAALTTLGKELREKLASIEASIHRLAGRSFNIASTKQLGEVLFDELKLPVTKRTKTGYSTDSDVLEKLASKHEIARELLEHRRVSKLINTYTDVLTESARPDSHRIHATFQQTVGATGRLISTDPDLQRTPVKTDEGRRIRKTFIAEPGWSIISADWSQIELRVLAHFSKDPRLVDALTHGHDIHRRTASVLFDVQETEVTKPQRDIAKTVNFATIYGQGATALSQILSVPRKDAERYIASYFEAYAGVRTWLDATIAEAHENGFVTTILGRRRRIPELKSNNTVDRQAGERIAANTPIQGSAADLCKLAMLEIDRAIAAQGLRSRMLLQIHDELLFEVPEGEVAGMRTMVREKMEHTTPLTVPLVVEVGVGPTWGDAH